MFIFGLKSVIGTIVTHKTEKLEDRKRTFETVIQVVRNEGDAYRVRLLKSILACEALHASPREEEKEEDTLNKFGERKSSSFQSLLERAVQHRRNSRDIKDYRQDRSGWIDQPLPTEKSYVSQNVVCNPCYGHGSYSWDWGLPYRLWKKAIADVESVSFLNKSTYHLTLNTLLHSQIEPLGIMPSALAPQQMLSIEDTVWPRALGNS